MAEENNKIEKTDSVKNKKDKMKEKSERQKKPGKMKRFVSYLKEMKSELKKVIWPGPKQVVNNTLVVIVTMVLSSAFIGVVDTIFKFIVGLLPNM